MNITKLIIAGGREFNDYPLMLKEVKRFIDEQDIDVRHLTIVSGTARGADSLAIKLAEDYNIPVIKMPADWDTHGKSAGYKRNTEMAQIATHLLAFWDGKSKGTGHMIDIATKRGLEVEMVKYTATLLR